jgi:hypothetical protein
MRQKNNEQQWLGKDLGEDSEGFYKGSNPKSTIHLSYCVSELNMTSFSDSYHLHTLFSIEWQADTEYEPWKTGSGSVNGQLRRTILEFAWKR